MPTDQEKTARMASGPRWDSHVGWSVAAPMAIDWLATTQMNHVPFAYFTTGRVERPSTAVQGTT